MGLLDKCNTHLQICTSIFGAQYFLFDLENVLDVMEFRSHCKCNKLNEYNFFYIKIYFVRLSIYIVTHCIVNVSIIISSMIN